MWVSCLRSHSDLLAVSGVKQRAVPTGRQLSPFSATAEDMGAVQSMDRAQAWVLGAGPTGRWSLSRLCPALFLT